MARSTITVPLSALPTFLTDIPSAELVAVALDEQASALRSSIDGDDGRPALSPVIVAGIRAQADRYTEAAKDIRGTADAIVAVHGVPS